MNNDYKASQNTQENAFFKGLIVTLSFSIVVWGIIIWGIKGFSFEKEV